ncbi:MAG: LytR C-terminal domain-containing protein [Elusimicrobia bacterium]|nr:LytR C-terminal domain-containing protein [Elusimicrobiota bacterium]
MEQSSGKKERLILAAGVLLALAASAAQYFFPASRAVMEGRDVRIALLSDASSALLVYHPFSGTVSAFSSPRRPPRGAGPERRAAELAAAVAGEGAAAFYVVLPSSPSLEALWGVLDGWRGDPRLLPAAAVWLGGRVSSGGTDLSWFDAFRLFAELSGLGASDFVLSDVPRGPAAEEEREARKAPLVEVFNASGRDGLADATARRLRAAGFDVITVGNKPAERETRIVSYSPEVAPALALREALGLGGLEIRVEPARGSVADAAVVLGEDSEGGRTENKGK